MAQNLVASERFRVRHRWVAAAVLFGVLPLTGGHAGAADATHLDATSVTHRIGPRSLRDITAAVARYAQGQILRITLVRKGARDAYLIKVLSPDRKRHDLVLDSRTLAIIEAR